MEPQESQIVENPESLTSQTATPSVSQSLAAKTAAEGSENLEGSKDKPKPAMAITTLPNEVLKIFIASAYEGTNPRDADSFISQCTIWFKKAKITDKDDRIGEALSLMKGRAMTWVTPHLVQWSENKVPFETWAAFADAFKVHFGNINDKAKAVAELGRLSYSN